MVLKSFPNKSLRKNWNMGGSRFKRVHVVSTISIIFDVTRSVFGPTEQPKSATFMQFGEESRYSLVIVSSSIGLALSINFFCIKIKVRSI